MDDFDDEIDEFLSSGVSEIERRHDLQRRVSLGAAVEFQATEPDSVLGMYMADRRRVAVEALVGMVGADPNGAIELAALQHVVQEYLNVRDWVRRHVEEAQTADQMINEDASGPETDDTDNSGRTGRRAARSRRRH